MRDKTVLQRLFAEHDIKSVVHFGGLRAVGESVLQPLRYYETNVYGTMVLCEVMAKARVFDLVFSSSVTVYGNPSSLPIREDFPVGNTTNLYGTSKYMVESVLHDLYVSDGRWNIAILRYFNPVGAHESGLIGEDPNDIPNNLVPFISQVAVGRRDRLSVFGGNYDTIDGNGVQDYIHVVDLALGHLKVLNKLKSNPSVVVYNLGTGYSVLQMIHAFEAGSGQKVPYEIVECGLGDVAACYADPGKTLAELGGCAERGFDAMMTDSWCWQSQNPEGYPK